MRTAEMREQHAAALPQVVARWPLAAREAFEERAAIKEFDGRLPRQQAEREAEEEVRAWWRAQGGGR